MRKLVILGNGFDLAHGLKTKYQDFILWFINKSFQGIRGFESRDNNLINISIEGPIPNNISFKSLNDFLTTSKANNIKVSYKHEFFKNIIRACIDYNWVDIESKYYKYLIELYKHLEKFNIENDVNIDKDLKQLHTCLDYVRDQLIEYLATIDKSINSADSEILDHFDKELDHRSESDVMYLNFNYTSTIELYLKNSQNINYIHGKLNDTENPIIFGYGDEIDIYYAKIERLNSNEFLNNFKSFGYFKTMNYQKLSNYIESGFFEVLIMGHSCGLSDRVLLSSIFQHKNCQRIKIYYHKRNALEDDYIEKTQEISRHFTADYKNKMRNCIVPKIFSSPLKKFIQ